MAGEVMPVPVVKYHDTSKLQIKMMQLNIRVSEDMIKALDALGQSEGWNGMKHGKVAILAIDHFLQEAMRRKIIPPPSKR
jgi:hypothetical protein